MLYNRRVSDYVLYDEAGIEERTGVPPTMYRGRRRCGDTSDNLPGVPGVGEDGRQAGDHLRGIDGIFEHLDEQTPKLRTSLASTRIRSARTPRS